MIIVNTKNYKTGNELLKLAQSIETHDVHTIIAVPAPDIYKIASKTVLPIYAQHVDVASEKSTGWLSAKSVKTAGASGTLLNHSEHSMPLEMLKETIEQCKQQKIITVVCAESLESVQKIATLRPEAIAFEDPQLIGTGRSITSYKTHDIKKFVSYLKGKSIVPICGAGISTIHDVQAAYALGCKGVLIASAIAQVKYPGFLLEQLAQWRRQL